MLVFMVFYRVSWFFLVFGWFVVRCWTLVTITMMMMSVLGWQWNSNQRQQPAELETEQEEKSNACHNVTHHGRHHYHRGRCHRYNHTLHHYHCIIASAMSNIIVALVTMSSRPKLKKENGIAENTHFFNLIKNYCNKPRTPKDVLLSEVKWCWTPNPISW